MMDDKKQSDPDGRAFTGHPDHPPGEADQPIEQNQELLREDGDSGEAADSGPQEGQSPGDQGTNLPGYG
jgi:hypothetical protein